VADVFRRYASEFLKQYGRSLSFDQRRAFDAVVACRTKLLGGHVQQCETCRHDRFAYNSCWNRHCPTCQAMDQAKWMEARAAELLPIPYFHLTFTLPQQIRPIALQNKRLVYGILFRAAAETLKDLAADPKHLGAEIGILAVLHTWGQKLGIHPHLHCVVSGGGIAPDRSRWIPCKYSRRKGKEFLLPRKVISRVFRGKFIGFLKRAYRRGELGFHGQIASFASPKAFAQCLNRSIANDWYVDFRRPFSSPQVVLKYLARYTHRVAISNRRLIGIEDGKVHFSYKDYADGGQWKTTALEPVEFIRRFLLHVLPSGFMRIRHYGLLANRFRAEKLTLCRELLGVSMEPQTAAGDDRPEPQPPVGQETGARCPLCGGRMFIIHEIPPEPQPYPFPRASRSPPCRHSA
jgi:hypothetical protein